MDLTKSNFENFWKKGNAEVWLSRPTFLNINFQVVYHPKKNKITICDRIKFRPNKKKGSRECTEKSLKIVNSPLQSLGDVGMLLHEKILHITTTQTLFLAPWDTTDRRSFAIYNTFYSTSSSFSFSIVSVIQAHLISFNSIFHIFSCCVPLNATCKNTPKSLLCRACELLLDEREL